MNFEFLADENKQNLQTHLEDITSFNYYPPEKIYVKWEIFWVFFYFGTKVFNFPLKRIN